MISQPRGSNLVAAACEPTWLSSIDKSWGIGRCAVRQELPYQASFTRSDDLLLVLHRSGPVGIEVEVDGRIDLHVVAAGSIHVVPAQTCFAFNLLEPVSTLHLWLPPSLGVVGRPDSLVAAPRAGIYHDPILHHLLEALALFVARSDSRSALAEQNCLQAVASHLNASLATATADMTVEAPPCALERRRVRAAVTYMEHHIDTPLAVETVADVVGISASRFARSFKQITGIAPHRFVSELRLRHARRMIAAGEPIVEVALTCGFSSQEHLTKRFREKFGAPPRRWRTAAVVPA